jgi:hypothetical protein
MTAPFKLCAVEPTLKLIAHGLVETVRRNVSIDWTVKESMLKQAELLCAD